MGTSFVKPGIDRTNVNPPMFTHYNIVPIYGTEDSEDNEVDATPNIDNNGNNNNNDNNNNQGSGMLDNTQEGEGETIIDKPDIKPEGETKPEEEVKPEEEETKPEPGAGWIE